MLRLIGLITIIILLGFFVIANPLEITKINELKEKYIPGLKLPSQNQPDNRTIGYQLLENNSVLNIWNEKHDYYFNTTSGIQFTNHYNDYWSHNVFCGGVKIAGSWNYYCNDELPFTWSIDTDNSTYINITGYKDVTKWISGNRYDVRFALRYHLANNDTSLTITPYEKNIGSNDILSDTGFAWHINQINIPNESIDYVLVDYDKYYFNQTGIKEYNDTEYEDLFIKDSETNEYIWINWSDNLNYILRLNGNTNSTTLMINAGDLKVGREKSTDFNWIDAECAWSCSMTAPTTNQDLSTGGSFSMDAEISYVGDCVTRGSNAEARYNQTKINSTTPLSTSATNPRLAFCSGGTCSVSAINIDADEEGFYTVQEYCGFNREYKYSSNKNVTVTSPDTTTCTYAQISTSTTLTQNNNTHCFNLTADDIIFDCDNYNLTGTQQANNFTFLFSNRDNVTIKNCGITNFTQIFFANHSQNVNIENINLFDNEGTSSFEDEKGKVFCLSNGKNYEIDQINSTNYKINNTLTGSCYDVEAVFFELTNITDSTFTSLDITNISAYYRGDTSGAEGCQEGEVIEGNFISLEDTDNLTFSGGVEIFKNTYNDECYFVDLLSLSNVQKNILFDSIDFVGNCRFDFDINNFTIQDSNFSSYNGTVDYFQITSTGDFIINNSYFHDLNNSMIISLTQDDLQIYESIFEDINMTGNPFDNINTLTLINNSFEDIVGFDGTFDALFEIKGEDSSIIGNTFNNIDNYAFLFVGSHRTNITDNIFTNIGIDAIYNLNSQNLTSLNSTSDIKQNSNSDTYKVKVGWKSRFNVTDGTSALSGAVVNVTEKDYDTSSPNESLTTDANGLTEYKTFWEGYLYNSYTVEANFTPHQINATYNGDQNDTQITINESTTYLITILGGDCWNYNSITKILYIPNDCLYYTEEGEFI